MRFVVFVPPTITAFYPNIEAKNQVVSIFDDPKGMFGAVFLCQFQVDTLCGNLEHENPCRPTGVVNVSIEILFHQFERPALEIAKMILVDESPSIDLCAFRNCSKFLLLLNRQRLVDGFEPVILIFAHTDC
jgi:hypothetical protein